MNNWVNWVIYGCLFFVLIIYFFVPDKEMSELECTKVDTQMATVLIDCEELENE